MNALVKDKISDLYKVCAKFPKPRQLESCECCHTEDEKTQLLDTELKVLTEEQLGNYTFSAFTTIGDADDFLYFLPRILELALTSEGLGCCDLGQIGDRLFQANYWERGDDLFSSVDGLLLTYFENEVLKREPVESEISDWVCCVGNATPNIEPFLKLLLASSNLKKFYEKEIQYVGKGKLSDPFWKSNHGNKKKVISWVLSDEVEERYWSLYK